MQARWWKRGAVVGLSGVLAWGALMLYRRAADPVVVAVGDLVCGHESRHLPCQQMATSDLALRLRPDAVVIAGDTQYEKGEYPDFLRYYAPSWGRLKAITYPSVGDHEYLTPGAAGYFDYFNGIGKFTGPVGDRDKGYYSFDLGAWHLIALNYNCKAVGGCGMGSPQEQWLRADLAAHQSRCTLAYWHRPQFSSGQHGGEHIWHSYDALWQALYEHHAELVVNGHDHDYERFAPQTPGGELDSAHGIRQFVVGTGGQRLAILGASGLQPHSEVFDETHFGVLKLILRPARYEWQFLSTTGAVIDSGTGQCHGPPSTVAAADEIHR